MRSFNFLALTFVLGVSSACEITSKANQAQTKGFLFPSVANQNERMLDDSEKEIGKRVCQALRKKRLHYETLSNNAHAFGATYAFKNCDQTKLSNELNFSVVLDNSNVVDMEYRSKDNDNNFKDVLTDQSAYLKTICDEFDKKTEKISNTVRSNLVAYTIHFKTINKGAIYDRLEMTKKVQPVGSNVLTVQSAEAFEIYSRTGQAEEKFMGVEVYKERYTSCGDNKNYSFYKETFTKPLTSFEI